MSITVPRSPRRVSHSIAILLLLFVPSGFIWAQVESDRPDTPEMGLDASAVERQAPAHQRGEGCGGRCDRASGQKGQGNGGHGCQGGHEGPARKGGGQGPRHGLLDNAHLLVSGHEQLERTVEEIPNGVRTVTTTGDPDLLIALRSHVREMSSLLDEGGHVRRWDPLFAEIFEHGDSIRIEVEEIADGVAITETSDDEEVVKLIRAHARKVDEFVAHGHAACRTETPLPADYSGR